MAKQPKLTDSQRELHSLIKAFIAKHGYPPTLTELALGLDLATNAVKGRLDGLIKKGYATRTEGVQRSIVLLK